MPIRCPSLCLSTRWISRGRIDFCGNDSRAHVVTPADEFRLLGGTGEPGDPWVLGR